MLNIDRYAYNSKLKDHDPVEKVVLALLTLAVCLWANNILISLIIIMLMGWVTVSQGRTPFRIFMTLMLVPMSFLLIGVLAIAVGLSTQPSDFWVSVPVFGQYLGVFKEGILKAAELFFRALGATACLYGLSLTTPMVDMLSVLRRAGCPQLLIELMSLIYRFIFVLIETADTMYLAQDARLGYIRTSTAYRSMGALISTLFIRAYKRSDDLYTALESRGYEGDLLVLEEPFKTKKQNLAMILGMNLVLIALTLWVRSLTGGLVS